MSVHKNFASFNNQFDPPLVSPDFFQRARCAGCSARLTHFAALVAVPTNTGTSRIVPLCPGCHSHTSADRPKGDDLARALDVWDNVARYLQLENANRAKKAVKK